MIAAYADPPYLGCGTKHYAKHHDSAGEFDTIEAHKVLVGSLQKYDGWAMSASSSSLHAILPLCPESARIAAWVKPFASFKPGVNPAFAWEPVVFSPCRKNSRERDTVRDWHSANITMKKGLPGAKPESFCYWVIALLGLEEGDDLVDLFPGTGVMGKCWDAVCRKESSVQIGLFEGAGHD